MLEIVDTKQAWGFSLAIPINRVNDNPPINDPLIKNGEINHVVSYLCSVSRFYHPSCFSFRSFEFVSETRSRLIWNLSRLIAIEDAIIDLCKVSRRREAALPFYVLTHLMRRARNERTLLYAPVNASAGISRIICRLRCATKIVRH